MSVVTTADATSPDAGSSFAVQAIHLVCAIVGVVPSVLAACDGRLCLAGLALLATGTALVHVSVPDSRALLPSAVDALASVLVTLGCGIALCSHRSLVGAIRVLWLIVLVTSSCGFNFVKEQLPSVSFVPNDVTISALVFGAVLLCSTAYLHRGTRAHRDARSIVVDVLFVLGALALRFRADVERVASLDVGLAVWHTMQWSAVLFTLCILHTPREQTTADERVVVVDVPLT